MPDWTREIRAAIARLEMDPAREASLVEELSQHLTDRYNELRGNGVDDAEACRLLLKAGAQRRHTGCGVEAAALAIAGGRRSRARQARANACRSWKRPAPGTAVVAFQSGICSGGDSFARAGHRRQHGHLRADRRRI